MLTFYPPEASRNRVEGSATISCKVDVFGKLQNCNVIAETPTDAGFGAALIAMSTRFTMWPLTKDGMHIGGATVRIPVRFTLPRLPDDTVLDADAITEPEWAKEPPPTWRPESYPRALARDGRPGYAALLCRAGPKGELLNCQLKFEVPTGLGVGDAAIRVLPRYRLKQTDIYGRATAGRQVLLRFRVPAFAAK
jgi:TonB family protein